MIEKFFFKSKKIKTISNLGEDLVNVVLLLDNLEA